MSGESNAFENWCVIEIMGHQRLAGFVTEQALGGANMLRVDVPENNGIAAFTTFLGASSIYRMTVVTEEIARGVAASIQVRPVSAYEMPKTQPALPRPLLDADDMDDDGPGF